ncbi:hypothetical protein J2Z48_002967 [Croceifilum oryzae]|uniref:Replication protein n=1 Tax=Croceifilum oryzae TaxID=1553429 RepID=A0AAJ1WTT8_9BACL|nr:AsnC family protein [Croceifilum oryzae]MDQ0418763.1 hypothetical protein [Croceifilum oryzae]
MKGENMPAVSHAMRQAVAIENWTDCYLSPSKKTGYVSTLQLPEKIQRSWGLNDIQKMLTYAQSHSQSNMYLSLNAFKWGSRLESDLMQIRNIGIDLDIYRVGATPREAGDELQCMILDEMLPEPNLLIHSGRGIQLIYAIEGGAAPQMSWFTRYITSQYIDKLSFLGADAQTTDPTRVLRFPGTVNQKNQVKATADIWNPEEYSLDILYGYVTPLEEIRKSRKKQKQNVVILRPPDGVVNLYSLNTKKKDDLELLVRLREGKMSDYRNTFLYTYAFTVGLILKNQKGTLTFTRQINERFTEPLLVKEVTETVKSAYEDAAAFLKAFAENEYQVRGLPSKLIKPEMSSTIIRKLDITSDEMEHFRVLIGRVIKRQRNTGYQREKRGSTTREEYVTKERQKTESKLEDLQKLLEIGNFTNKELAEKLGVTVRRVQQLKKELSDHSVSL